MSCGVCVRSGNGTPHGRRPAGRAMPLTDGILATESAMTAAAVMTGGRPTAVASMAGKESRRGATGGVLFARRWRRLFSSCLQLRSQVHLTTWHQPPCHHSE